MESTVAKYPELPAATALDVCCFHCGLPLPANLDLSLTIDGAERSMCCQGCLAVAQAIIAAGHENFYRVRTEAAPTGQPLLPEFLRGSEIYDASEVQGQYLHELAGGSCEVSLILEGITCAACTWLIEQTLASLPGVEQVRVNYATQRALLRWNRERLKLSEILQAIQHIGYRALPYNPRQQQQSHQRQRRQQQRRLAVAGVFGMQVMMLSISLYAGAWSGMEAGFEQFFRWLGLGLTLPVVGYAALPFFTSAWRDLRQRRISMDLPVSIAILIAFASSCLATASGQGEVYFDSVVMFVFLLSASRYFESMARQRCAASVERLVQALPLTALRMDVTTGEASAVAASALRPGERVLIRPGETVPADGVIRSGFSALDESLLSGEAIPLDKAPGDRLLGGSINVTNPLQMEVTAIGADTVMAEIERSIERAQADRPPLALFADRVAARFISLVLLIVLAVAAYWWLHGSAQWFEIALAVLIVSCPCALSLATPTAISASLGNMQLRGLLVKRAAVLETLHQVTHVVFDKTGTLTHGAPLLDRIRCLPPFTADECLALAAALERHSAHPLARALVRKAGARQLVASDVTSVAGGGLQGTIDARHYCIGSVEFVTAEAGICLPPDWLDDLDDDAQTAVVLAGEGRALALFSFVDELRADAVATVAALQARGKQVLLMSGDRLAVARQVARQCGVDDCRAEMTPAAKIAAVQALQAANAVVLMVGDGINDAPVLAGADASIAMAGASSLAKVNADIVLLRDCLAGVGQVFDMAARTHRITRQNIGWALLYNFTAIPAAAMGLVAPWLAALGMSLSSLLVVINALRLTR
jgi:P-type Cu2+ transporter